MKILIELSDNELRLVTEEELEEMERSCAEFDGFEDWVVKGTLVELSEVTRVEVIDPKGRKYVNKNKHCEVELSLQDEGRTLKVFIKDKKE